MANLWVIDNIENVPQVHAHKSFDATTSNIGRKFSAGVEGVIRKKLAYNKHYVEELVYPEEINEFMYPQNVRPLNFYETMFLLTILNQTTSGIHLLSSLGDPGRLVLPQRLKEPINKRFGTKAYVEDEIFSQETGEMYESVHDRLMFEKLSVDRGYVTRLLQEVIIELRNKFTYTTLCEAIQKEKSLNYDEYTFVTKGVKNRIKLRNLQEYPDEYLGSWKIKIRKIDNVILDSEIELHEETLMNNIEMRLVHNWEKSRIEQQQAKWNKNEKFYTDQIQFYKEGIETENQCRLEFNRCMMIQIDALKAEVEDWMHRIDKEVESVEIDIQIIKEDREEFQKKCDEIHAIYERRDKEMRDYKMRKANEKQILVLAKYIVRLQAWWRGVMVRKQLGPYAKKKKGSKKGKDKKKGRKK